MRIIAIVFTLLAFAAKCSVQALGISGIVRDSAGNGIQGAVVRLGKADIATITGQDGSFTLMGTPEGVWRQTGCNASGKGRPFVEFDGGLFFKMEKHADVKVMVYDCNGRLLVSHSQTIPSGGHALAFPRFAGGIHLYNVSVNNERYTFKSIAGTGKKPGSMVSWKVAGTAKQASAEEPFDDALLFTKKGFQLRRCAITNPDTAGMTITMISFVTGAVTDADGNVYRTIQYGNQVWTVENLRTKKYNDGENIPVVTDSVTWSGLETPGCCFFDYTTDTAEQKKWGALYNWYAVGTGKLAPAGWHVSTDEDWDTLENYLIAGGYNYDGTTSENKIAKSIVAETDWLPSTDPGAPGNDPDRNNATGFSGLPTGYCDYSGYTYYRNWYSFWWTATTQDSSFVKIRGSSYYAPNLQSTAFTKIYGLSVRLVRDN